MSPDGSGLSSSSLTGPVMRWFDEHASDGIVITDEALIIRSWNRWLVSATGFEASQVVGRSIIEVFPSLVDRGLAQYYTDALAGEVKVVSQTLHQYLFPSVRSTPPRQSMLQSGRIAPLYEGATVVGTITVIEDASERVATERELRKRIATAEAACHTAEAASRVKDEFLATLSHEIRTPLNAVLGWTRILRSREGLDETTVRRAIEVIDRNASAQLTLISDMLDMARIAAGKVRIEMGVVDLVAGALAAIDVVRPAAESKNVRLSAALSASTPPVLGDADRLQQVIWNLLSNAVKFTEPGGAVAITLDTSGADVVLVVADTGQGIPASFLPEIFQRFKQAESSSSRHHGGLGLGLALVSELVALHGGAVRADSAGPGLGSTFTVRLPAYHAAAKADAPSAGVAGPPVERLDGVRVLIIEDEPDAREILARTLADAGGLVAEAASSGAALQYLRDGRDLPLVIVTDIGMPGDDGYAFLRRLRQEPPPSGEHIPAVALTAFATPTDRARALAAGFAAHVSKPFVPAILVHTVATLALAPRRDAS